MHSISMSQVVEYIHPNPEISEWVNAQLAMVDLGKAIELVEPSGSWYHVSTLNPISLLDKLQPREDAASRWKVENS